MLSSLQGSGAVVDDDGVYRGVIEIETIVAAIRSMRAEARQGYRGEEAKVSAGEPEQSELVS